jgi:hypothetical protein
LFFLEAFQRLGGSVKQREHRRYEVTHVSAPVRNRDQTLALLLLRLFGREQIGIGRGVVHHLREDHRTRRRQWPPRPPQMQRRGMPVPDRLLSRRRLVDGL